MSNRISVEVPSPLPLELPAGTCSVNALQALNRLTYDGTHYVGECTPDGKKHAIDPLDIYWETVPPRARMSEPRRFEPGNWVQCRDVRSAPELRFGERYRVERVVNPTNVALEGIVSLQHVERFDLVDGPHAEVGEQREVPEVVKVDPYAEHRRRIGDDK